MITDSQLPVAEASRPELAGPTGRVWMRFRRNTVGMMAATLVALFFLIAILTGICAWLGLYFPHDPNATNLALKLKPPKLGTLARHRQPRA